MSDQSLLIVDYQNRTVTATDYVRELEETALAESALVGKVDSAKENETAVKAQTALAGYVRLVRKAEEAVKGPLNDLRNKVIAKSRELCKTVDEEGNRIARLIGDYQEKERIRIKAEQDAANRELAELARKEAVEVSTAKTIEEQDAIKEKFASQALATQSTVKEAPKAVGQVVRTDWQITVTDPYKLARFHPSCVKITPALSEIKALLNDGVQVAGIEAKKVTNSTVRAGKETKAIEA